MLKQARHYEHFSFAFAFPFYFAISNLSKRLSFVFVFLHCSWPCCFPPSGSPSGEMWIFWWYDVLCVFGICYCFMGMGSYKSQSSMVPKEKGRGKRKTNRKAAKKKDRLVFGERNGPLCLFMILYIAGLRMVIIAHFLVFLRRGYLIRRLCAEAVAFSRFASAPSSSPRYYCSLCSHHSLLSTLFCPKSRS